MNDYIFDWEENCKKMIDTHKCTTKNKQMREQVSLFRYLLDLGVGKDEIFNIWIKLDSKITNTVRDNIDDANEQFAMILKRAAKWKIP